MFSQYPNFNYHQTSKQMVLDLIYFTNGIRLDSETTGFGLPEVYLQPPKPGDIFRDTKIDVHVQLLGEGYRTPRGTKRLFYKRLDIGVLEYTYRPLEAFNTPVRTLDLLPQINALYGLQLVPQDIVDEFIGPENVPYKLKANQNSLAWVGETKINLKFKELMIDRVNLRGFYNPHTTFVPIANLSGFKVPIVYVQNLTGF